MAGYQALAEIPSAGRMGHRCHDELTTVFEVELGLFLRLFDMLPFSGVIFVHCAPRRAPRALSPFNEAPDRSLPAFAAAKACC